MNSAEVKGKLRQFICTELLKNPSYPLRDDEPLVTSGLMDSFSLAQVGVFVETSLNVYISDTDLTVDSMDTLNQITDLVLCA